MLDEPSGVEVFGSEKVVPDVVILELVVVAIRSELVEDVVDGAASVAPETKMGEKVTPVSVVELLIVLSEETTAVVVVSSEVVVVCEVVVVVSEVLVELEVDVLATSDVVVACRRSFLAVGASSMAVPQKT